MYCILQVGVRVEAENMRTGARRHCCSAYLTFVSLDSKRQQQQQQQGQQQQQQGQQLQAKALVLPRVVPMTSENR
jgi:acyl-CoA hydrolase